MTCISVTGARGLNRRALIVGAAAALALSLVSLALAARAGAYVYWTSPDEGTIGRASLDGSDVDQSFITGSGKPHGIAVDARHVYWTGGGWDTSEPSGNEGTNTIGRANLDATDVDQSILAPGTAFFMGGVALDAGHLYWTGAGMIGWTDVSPVSGSSGFVSNIGLPTGIAVDADHGYWAYASGVGSEIARADIGGGNLRFDFIGGVEFTGAIAVDADHIYWGNSDAIGRANLDGSDVDQSFITGSGKPHGIAVDARHVYWTNSDTNTIGRANLDGSDADLAFIAGANDPFGIAVDALPNPTPPATAPDTTAPQTEITKGARNKTDKAKLRFRFTSSEADSTFECKLDKHAYRACESPRKVRRLDEGRHRFKVRAIDTAGNVDRSAAKDTFKVNRPR